ncbi:MAG: hypothetical protein AAF721_11235 [Myxococcota bacterium]
MFLVASFLVGIGGGCAADRGEATLPGGCGAGQPGCFGDDGGAETGDAPQGSDGDSGSEGEPLPPADDGAADGSPAGTGAGPADIPDDDRPEDDGGADECGSAFSECLEDGGDLVSCLPLFEDCGGDGGADGGDPGDYPDCCDAVTSTCGEGPPDSTCGAVEEVCESGDCASLREICPADQIPVSEACALGYRACHPGFAVNNCVRILYGACVLMVDDEAFCAEREEACDARIAYCQELLGPGHISFIPCAENGQYFDPCWVSLGCGAGNAACTPAALQECANPTQGLCASTF